jgi:predicted MPP superfamily phosphohydrolase
MRSPIGLLIFISILVLIDFYVFSFIKSLTQFTAPKYKYLIGAVFWGATILSIIIILMFAYTEPDFLGKKLRTYLFAFVIGLFLAKLLATLFFLIDDSRRLVQWGFKKVATINQPIKEDDNDGISRSAFLTWLGIAAGSTLFGSLLVGFSNQYNYKVVRQKLTFNNLPFAFKGMKVVHISDIHSGSFMDSNAVARGIKLIKEQEADLILFTGDLVNNRASEMHPYKEMFSTLKAPLGIYSILGNHDYGDYVQWPDDGLTKQQNLSELKNIHAAMGWRLLMNEHVVLERDNEQIALIGIENWSARADFPKYGRLDLAYKGTEKYQFKILMSHDPSHWHAQVRKEYADIDLTLSGHTHGMQFGLELPGFKWSPIQYVYKEWAGLYKDNSSQLYVNRGFGFLGYPGRVGVMPEITVFEFV